MYEVTVLLPVYNAGRFLMEAIESILSQTHANFELLVVDDGSTDGSATVLDDVDDSRIRIIRQANQGLVGALNTGLMHAQSELIARMDADDISNQDRLARQIDYLIEHPEVAAVGSCYQLIDVDGAVVGTAHVAGSSKYLQRQLYFRNVFPHGGMLFRRSDVLAAGGYRDIGPAEDYDLWIRLAERHRLAIVPDVLYRYRVNASGLSSQLSTEQRASVRRVRSALHDVRPLVVTWRQVVRDGRDHQRDYAGDCPFPLYSYLYDHVWLTILCARQSRWKATLSLVGGTLCLFMRYPRQSIRGFLARA